MRIVAVAVIAVAVMVGAGFATHPAPGAALFETTSPASTASVALSTIPVVPVESAQLANCVPETKTEPAIVWKKSTAIGRVTRGKLHNGVVLPAVGSTYVTWDPGSKLSPSPAWRRSGTDALIRTTLCVLDQYREANPTAPRVLLGDISLPNGGPFGREYGGLGHASHQNGLDIDVYYPLLDRQETPPKRVEEIDRRRAQELIDRFVAANATTVYVGRGLGLTGPSKIVQTARGHLDHFHVRFPAALKSPPTPTPIQTPTPTPIPTPIPTPTPTPTPTTLVDGATTGAVTEATTGAVSVANTILGDSASANAVS